MKVFDKLILVSKKSILEKHFNIDMEEYNKLSEKEKEAVKDIFPSEEEKAFMEVYKSTLPQLERLRKKMSVCLDVEVLDYDFDFINFTYAGSNYKIIAPKNAYRICNAIEKGVLEGLQELCKQGCVFKDEKNVNDIKTENSLLVDEIQILKLVSDKFFFMTSIQ